MAEKRKNPRYATVSHARIPGIMEGKNLLMDISVTGCRVECRTVSNIQSGTQYQLEVEPEKVSRIGCFMLQVECTWVRSTEDSTELGFFIVASPKGDQFLNYVDYLAYRSSHP